MSDSDTLLGALHAEVENKMSANALKRHLDWNNDRFVRIRNDALSHGHVVTGAGGGGGVISLTDLGSDLIEFISSLKDKFNGQCGNISLRRELNWTEARYLTVQSHALDLGRVARARGKGGSVRIISEEEALEDHLQTFIQTLQDEFGGYAGNIALRNKLEWEEDHYWLVRDLAISRDLIARGRGKGGTVYLFSEEEEEESEQRIPERELYEPALNTIQNTWIEQLNYDDNIVRITAHRGRVSTGGTWTRPDVSILAITSYKFPPRRMFEIITFEIKPADGVSILGVFEALSHKQFAHRSYVLYHFGYSADNEEMNLEDYPEGARILQTARKYGVGVVVASSIEDWETWNILLEPEYSLPDPEQSDLFVSTCFDDGDHQVISSWFA